MPRIGCMTFYFIRMELLSNSVSVVVGSSLGSQDTLLCRVIGGCRGDYMRSRNKIR